MKLKNKGTIKSKLGKIFDGYNELSREFGLGIDVSRFREKANKILKRM